MKVKWYYVPSRLLVVLFVCLAVSISYRFVPQYIPMWLGITAAIGAMVVSVIIYDKYKPKESTFFYWFKHRK